LKTFGNKFRKERERLRYSIEDVASVTKIGARMLKAIEDEHFDLLPGGVFTKGFIRAYAKHLGMNDQEVVAEYLECLRQRQIDALPAVESPISQPARGPGKKRAASAQDQSRSPQAKQTQTEEELPHLQLPKSEHVRPPKRDFPIGSGSRLSWKLIAICVLALVFSAILWIRHGRGSTIVAAKPAVPTVQLPVQSAAAPLPVNSANRHNAVTYKEVAARKENLHAIRASGASSQESQLLKPAAPTNRDGESDPASASAPVSYASNNAKPLMLVIRASENSWISIIADGQPVAHETLIAPAHTTVRAAREITVRTGNAAGLNFLLNGKAIPPQGAESEVKTLVFNGAGLIDP